MKLIDKYKLIDRNFMQYNHMVILHHNMKYYMHKREAAESEKWDIFDVDKIPEKIYYYRKEIYPHNSYYGIEGTLRKYAGWKKPIHAFIEHGISDKSDVEEKEFYQYNKPAYITFGDMREAAITKRINTRIIKVGPYIYYAAPWYTEEQETKVKEKYGKILTVFPVHTINRWKLEYKIDDFYNEINRYKKAFNIDTVFLCGYWNDIILGNLAPYAKYDFVWVSAGHAMDQNFLSRLKTIIRLSDYTMSNKFGTYVGYSLALNKPHYIYTQECITKDDDGCIRKDGFQEETNAFNDFVKYNTAEQIEMAEYVFGLNNIHSPEDLRSILEGL